MKKAVIIILFLFPYFLFAQTNYHQGLVIKNNGDTLKGFIDYREWTFSPKSIDFKNNLTEKQPLSFNPQSIKGFQVGNNATYKSYLGIISLNKVGVEELQIGPDTTQKVDTVFLEQVATGKNISLFYHHDLVKTRFFIAEGNGNPFELKNFIHFNELHEVLVSQVYKGQLTFLINKYCPKSEKLAKLVNNADYNQNALEKIVNGINDEKVISQKLTGHRYYIGSGFNYNTTSINGIKYNSITPKLNLGIDVFNNPSVQQLIIRFDVSFSYIIPSIDKFDHSPLAGIFDSYTYNQYNTTFTPQILFNFYNQDKLKLFIGGGLGFNLAFYSNNKIQYTDNNNQTYIRNNPFTLNTFYFNFPMQTGIVLNNKIELNISYMLGSNYLGGNQPFTANNQIMGLSIKYMLGK